MEWKIQDTSTIGVIDRVFGLPYGADISGTTADELYFLTGCADINSGDPVMRMLPLAVHCGRVSPHSAGSRGSNVTEEGYQLPNWIL